ncbi:hypothetical protein Emtol_3258 [Emticicia oligotrophica DSM 17448]|jgi:hypothetical protein|uniref:SatD family protein n=1 Tax=Emticicia oligotrophica (strain DSM 17448 / CIP 109782 / MTCC 6937 / GPTSA100-15) TaxID=929562 RepID=A0ABN4APM2_EMTOG|nr:SatD family protein [Emticicia oligotrophica]AFK04387.1 hypothetical protein Emtol_3258 [Emticicia oligotrophica DSM 17448]
MQVQVITGDIVKSSNLDAESRLKLRKAFDFLSSISEGKYDYFIRGDSFQILLNKNALHEALIIKTYLHIKLSLKVKISIGLGEVTFLSEKISDSDGEAFWLSGRNLDDMKNKNEFLRISTNDNQKNKEWEVYCSMIDYLFEKQTVNQSEVIFWLLQGKNQQEIASIIKIGQPSVSTRIKSSAWHIIEKILNRFQNV